MPRVVHPTEHLTVWHAWTQTRPNPSRCHLSDERNKLIDARLKLSYRPADLITLIRYINDADEDLPRYMRGDNNREREYLDLANILRIKKLGERVELAKAWNEGSGPDEGPAPSTGVDLGPLGPFVGGSSA